MKISDLAVGLIYGDGATLKRIALALRTILDPAGRVRAPFTTSTHRSSAFVQSKYLDRTRVAKPIPMAFGFSAPPHM